MVRKSLKRIFKRVRYLIQFTTATQTFINQIVLMKIMLLIMNVNADNVQ